MPEFSPLQAASCFPITPQFIPMKLHVFANRTTQLQILRNEIHLDHLQLNSSLSTNLQQIA